MARLADRVPKDAGIAGSPSPAGFEGDATNPGVNVPAYMPVLLRGTDAWLSLVSLGEDNLLLERGLIVIELQVR